jgi:kynurenine formamidase
LRTNAENFQLEICRTKATHGWNATTITMYSHLATHMDAPCHFIEGAATIDKTNLEQCVGPAKVINLTPMAPKELITVERFLRAAPPIQPGDRLLLRTDWHRQLGSPAYRNELPRISRELANWFVTQQVSLIGIEQSSVADVNNLPEVTEVHEILFRGGVIIVEALANLDQITQPIVEFIALPLNIVGGDGCPVRAIAIEEVKT